MKTRKQSPNKETMMITASMTFSFSLCRQRNAHGWATPLWKMLVWLGSFLLHSGIVDW